MSRTNGRTHSSNGVATLLLGKGQFLKLILLNELRFKLSLIGNRKNSKTNQQKIFPLLQI